MLVDLCRRAPSQLIILALLCFSVKASHNVSFSPMVEGYSTTNTTLLQMPQNTTSADRAVSTGRETRAAQANPQSHVAAIREGPGAVPEEEPTDTGPCNKDTSGPPALMDDLPGTSSWISSALAALENVQWIWAAFAVNAGAAVAAWTRGFFDVRRAGLDCCQQLQMWAALSLAVAVFGVGCQTLGSWESGDVPLARRLLVGVSALSAVALATLVWYNKRYAPRIPSQVACFRLQARRELCWLSLHAPFVYAAQYDTPQTFRAVVTAVLLVTGSMIHLLFWASTQPCKPAGTALGMVWHLLAFWRTPSGQAAAPAASATTPAAGPQGASASTATTAAAPPASCPVSGTPPDPNLPVPAAGPAAFSPPVSLLSQASPDDAVEEPHEPACLRGGGLDRGLVAPAFVCYFRFMHCLLYCLFLGMTCWDIPASLQAKAAALLVLGLGLAAWLICGARLTIARLQQAYWGGCRGCEGRAAEAANIWAQLAFLH